MGMLVAVAAGGWASSAIASAVAGTVVGGITISGIAAGAIGAVGGAVVSGLVGSALVGKPSNAQFEQAARGILINATSNVGAIPVIYGSRRVGGTQLPPMVIGENNNMLILVTIFCEGPIQAVRTLYLDGLPVDDARFAGNIVYSASYTGTDAQTADSYLLAKVPGWSASDRFLGCAYNVLALTFNQTAFPNGKPVVTADIEGRLLYDPRDGGTRFSHNAALAIRDYHAHARYGRGIASGSMDDTAFVAAADDCETRIALASPSFSADPGTDRLTFTADMALDLAAEVQVFNSGGALPAGLAANTIYFAIPLSASIIQLAVSQADAAAGTAVDITGTGSGIHTLKRAPMFVVDPDTDVIVFDHDELFGLGDGVQCVTSGTLPAGLAAATTYYFIPRGVNTLKGRTNGVGIALAGLAMNCGKLATSYANALAGVAIDLTTGGTGVHALVHVDMPQYTCDGVLNPDDGWLDNLRALLSSCRGIRPFTGGKYRLLIDQVTTPTAFGFDEDNIVGAWTVQGRGKKSSFNRVTAQFFNPAKNWQPDFAVYDSSADRTIDNGLLLESKISLMCTTGYHRAMMIAQIEEQQSRFGTMVQFHATVAGIQCEVGDVTPITESGYGWLAKPFRILQMELLSSDEVEITCREYDDSAYNVTAIPQARTYPATKLPDPFTIARQIPPNVSGLEIFGQGRDRDFTGRDCKFSWRRASNTGTYEFGLEPWGADGGLLDYYFKDFKVEIHRRDGVLLRTEYVQDPVYTYTFEHNSDDNAGVPLRDFAIYVWQRTKYDQVSALPAQLEVSNPAPTDAALTITPSFNNAGITYPKPSDIDWNGLRFYVSPISGFTPDASNLVYDGVDAAFLVNGLSENTDYYYVYALSDSFGYGPNSAQGTFSTTANPAAIAAAAAQADATTALGELTDIASDNILSPVEKPKIIQDNTVILAEQTGIDAQATAYSITTEKTAYDNAVSALTAYLGTLTAPVAWNNVSGNTTIVGTTFRSKFSDVYTTRQTLINKIAAIAGTLATWSGVSGAGKPADDATVNVVTSGSAAPTGGTNGDLYFRTSNSSWYAKISGTWSAVSDVTASNIAAGIASQGNLATLDTVGTSQIDNNAVTRGATSFAYGPASAGNTQEFILASVTLTTTGAPVDVMATCYVTELVDSLINCHYYLNRDGTYNAGPPPYITSGSGTYLNPNPVKVTSPTGSGNTLTVELLNSDEPAAGAHTYYFIGYTPVTSFSQHNYNVFLKAKEYKK